MGRRRARAMFRNRQTGASDDKSCRRRNIKSFRCTRAGSRGVDETLVMAPHRNGAISHGLRHAGQLFDCFTFHGQNSKRRRHLRVGGGRTQQRLKKLLSFSTAEILAAHQAQCHLTEFEIADVNCLVLEFICSRWRWQQPTGSCDPILIFRGIDSRHRRSSNLRRHCESLRHRARFADGLLVFQVWVRVGDNTRASLKVRFLVFQHGTAQRDA